MKRGDFRLLQVERDLLVECNVEAVMILDSIYGLISFSNSRSVTLLNEFLYITVFGE